MISDLRQIKLDHTAKPLLRQLAKDCGILYCDIEKHGNQEYVIFTSGNYSQGFKEFKLLREDLTLENLKFMVENGFSR